MKKKGAYWLLAAWFAVTGVAAAQPSAAPTEPAPVSLSLANPAIGQPASSLGLFSGSGLWQAARQTMASFWPTLNLMPDQALPAPPALPPSLLTPGALSAGNSPAMDSPTTYSPTSGSPAPRSGGALARGDVVLPGGIVPLRASSVEPLTALSRKPLSLAAKAEALRAPLRHLADTGVAQSDSDAERASRDGRMISDIVADDWSAGPASFFSQSGRSSEASSFFKEASLRDAVAQAPSAASADAAAAFAAAEGPARTSGPAAVKSMAFDEAVDAALTFEGQSAAGSRGAASLGDASSPRRPAASFDLSLLVLHVYEHAVRFSRATLGRLAGGFHPSAWLSDSEPVASGQFNQAMASPESQPTYALGVPEPEAGRSALRQGIGADAAWNLGRRQDSNSGVFEAPDSAELPRSLPAPLAYAMLLPLVGVALFYLRELRR